MAFHVSATAYDAFMGRFSRPLAEVFLDTVARHDGHDEVLGDVLDVGCGPGALTKALTRRTGVRHVTAVDPQPAFVAAVRGRCPEVNAAVATAEALPFADDSFDTALAQLVVHFMSDPVEGLREMRRVTRAGGRVAACVWDHAGGGSPLDLFWRAVTEIDSGAPTERTLAGAAQGQLAWLAWEAGLAEVADGSVVVNVGFESFEEWWRPFTLGVGPAGDHVAGLDATGVRLLRDRCRRLLPPEPFVVGATAWYVRARS